MQIRVVPLGAGQDVGRSCVLVTVNGRNIMFDCGMHMGYNDERRFPDFSYISQTGNMAEVLDCVIITHFHLDHCGALPYFTEVVGYDGPVFMTQPTKAIAPILLEDYRKILSTRHGEGDLFTSEHIKACMKKVTAVSLHQTIRIDAELSIKAYYAGHVLGAAMFHVQAGDASVVYTGDYNMTPDRHLGAAWIDCCRPDLLITESTYATTIRDSRRVRERDFLSKVYSCVSNGGKVLIPVFALGRAQELCILLDTYWERMGIKAPIYFSAGLTAKANDFYKLFIPWTNQKIKGSFVERNMFDFRHIQVWDRSYADIAGPMVLFSTPGMLHGGTSLEVFCKWAGNPKNMIIMPGYCVTGTVGWKVLQGHKEIEVDGRPIPVRLSVQNLSFSAHADAKGILQLIRMAQPAHVMLVHGEAHKMEFLQQRIEKEFGVPCYFPANGHTVTIAKAPAVPVLISPALLKRHARDEAEAEAEAEVKRTRNEAVDGVIVAAEGEDLWLVSAGEVLASVAGLGRAHELRFTMRWRAEDATALDRLHDLLAQNLPGHCAARITRDAAAVAVDTVRCVHGDGHLVMSWAYQDEALAEHVTALIASVWGVVPDPMI